MFGKFSYARLLCVLGIGFLTYLLIQNKPVSNIYDETPTIKPDEHFEQRTTQHETESPDNKSTIATSDQAEEKQFAQLQAPHKQYLQNIKDAEAGKPIAQYLVSEALSRCEWPHYPESDYFAELRTQLEQAQYQEEVISKYIESQVADAEECKPLYRLTAPEDLKILEEAWRDAASDSGDPFALLEISIYHSDGIPKQDYLRLLNQAFESIGRNPVLRQKALDSALYYYSHFEENDNPHAYIEFSGKRGLERDAWEILRCQYKSSCNPDEFYVTMLTNYGYTQSEIEPRISRASELKKLLNDQRWSELGFPAPEN